MAKRDPAESNSVGRWDSLARLLPLIKMSGPQAANCFMDILGAIAYVFYLRSSPPNNYAFYAFLYMLAAFCWCYWVSKPAGQPR